MSAMFYGNVIVFNTPAGQIDHIILPDGYSIEKIIVAGGSGIRMHPNIITITQNIEYSFPVVNGKSPCELYNDNSKGSAASQRWVFITKFGAKPYLHYFDKAFEPILVTGKDGEYNMIPSDQFK